MGLFCNNGAGLPETAELREEVWIRERGIQIFNRRKGVSEIFIWRETLGEVQIRVGQHSQQTLEVSPGKGGTHLAVWHTAARCGPRCPVTHLFDATAEYKQCSSSCVNGYRTVSVICELVSSLGSLYIIYLSSHTANSQNGTGSRKIWPRHQLNETKHAWLHQIHIFVQLNISCQHMSVPLTACSSSQMNPVEGLGEGAPDNDWLPSAQHP